MLKLNEQMEQYVEPTPVWKHIFMVLCNCVTRLFLALSIVLVTDVFRLFIIPNTNTGWQYPKQIQEPFCTNLVSWEAKGAGLCSNYEKQGWFPNPQSS